ncbi:hypothetical protein GCM10025777_15440 [Membranihabitans marinus]
MLLSIFFEGINRSGKEASMGSANVQNPVKGFNRGAIAGRPCLGNGVDSRISNNKQVNNANTNFQR